MDLFPSLPYSCSREYKGKINKNHQKLTLPKYHFNKGQMSEICNFFVLLILKDLSALTLLPTFTKMYSSFCI